MKSKDREFLLFLHRHGLERAIEEFPELNIDQAFSLLLDAITSGELDAERGDEMLEQLLPKTVESEEFFTVQSLGSKFVRLQDTVYKTVKWVEKANLPGFPKVGDTYVMNSTVTYDKVPAPFAE